MNYYTRHLGDYAKKAGKLSMLEHGAYTILIDACYDREQFPTEEEAIDWSWARTEQEIDAVKFVLRKFFKLVDGRYFQKRIQEVIDEYHEKCRKNSKIATEREEKRTQRARFVHDISRDVHDDSTNRHLTNNQEPITNNHKPRTKKNTAPACAVVRPDSIPESVWDDFLEVRKNKRLPLTQTAWQQLHDEILKSGLTPEQALRECCGRGWGGFKAAWLVRDQNKNSNFGQAKDPLDRYKNLMLPVSERDIADYEEKQKRKENQSEPA